jgi:hypothetical protein
MGDSISSPRRSKTRSFFFFSSTLFFHPGVVKKWFAKVPYARARALDNLLLCFSHPPRILLLVLLSGRSGKKAKQSS